MKPWWERYPDRWQAELDALTAAGYPWTLEEQDPENALARLTVLLPPETLQAHPGENVEAAATEATLTSAGGAGDWVVGDGEGGPVRLEVLYPPTYPLFPPVVKDPGQRLPLTRHRQPSIGTLCLTSTDRWDLTTTVAALLTRQLPRLLDTTDPDPEPGLEVPAGEPLGHTTPRQVCADVLVDGAWHIPAHVGQGQLWTGFVRTEGDALASGMVKTVYGEGLRLDTLTGPMGDMFPIEVAGRWTRWPTPPTGPPEALWEAVEPTLGALPAVDQHDPPNGGPAAEVELIGLLVPSEMVYRQPGEQWFFLLRQRPTPGAPPRTELYHSALAGPGDYRARIPGAAGCEQSRVLLVGCGALGSSLGLELARAGVGALELLDGDLVEPAAGCRQLAPAYFAGVPKVLALRQLLRELVPHARLHAHLTTLGAPQATPAEEPDAHAGLVRVVARSDLVIDAAADPAVSRYLTWVCLGTGTDFLHVSATAGGHGGLVALLPAGARACWWCLLHHRHDHTVPFPPAADPETGAVTPAGCAAPTFTGTGADLAGIAAHATRVALHQLAACKPDAGSRNGRAGGGSGRLYVASLVDHNGVPIPLRWRTRTLTRHPACAMHNLPRQQPSADPSAQQPRGSVNEQKARYVS